MPIQITFLPWKRTVAVSPGTTVMQAAGKAGIRLRSRCGGQAACLMCKVFVDKPEHLFPVSEREHRKMGNSGNQRLACQTRARENIVVTVPEDPLKAAVRAGWKR